ncbi:MAG: ribonuclease Z, partial [Myxococcota bacterium]
RLRAAGLAGPAIKNLQRDGFALVNGQRVELEDVSVPRPGQSIAVLMDSRPCDNALALARDAEVVVAAATYLESERAQAEARMDRTALEAGRLAAEAGARQLILTHFDPMYAELEPFLEEASRAFPNVALAGDGRRFPIPRPKKP